MNYEMILGLGIVAAGCVWIGAFIFLARKTEYWNDTERAQAFVFSKKQYDYVFVGSGLIGHLDLSGFDSAFNLYFPYYGSCVGMQIIALSNKIPKAIFIETNFIFKGIKEDMIQKVFYKKESSLNMILIVNGIQRVLTNLAGKFYSSFAQFFYKKNSSDFNKKGQVGIGELLQIFNQTPDHNKVKLDFTTLKNNMELLGAKGCRLFFFQVPVDARLYDTASFQMQRSEMERMFVKGEIDHIPDFKSMPCQTEDGLHLTAESFRQFNEYLNSEIRKLKI